VRKNTKNKQTMCHVNALFWSSASVKSEKLRCAIDRGDDVAC